MIGFAIGGARRPERGRTGLVRRDGRVVVPGAAIVGRDRVERARQADPEAVGAGC